MAAGYATNTHKYFSNINVFLPSFKFFFFSKEQDYLSLLELPDPRGIPDPGSSNSNKNNKSVERETNIAALDADCTEEALDAESTRDDSETAVEELLDDDVEELLDEDFEELLGGHVNPPNQEHKEGRQHRVKFAESIDMVEEKEMEEDTDMEEHGNGCDCLDCDDVDFLHGFVDGEPFGIK